MNKGIVLVYTGDGKGKTTAALGLAIRATGWGEKVCIIQFLKSEDFNCGEKIYCKNNNIEIYSTGIGYSWTKTEEEQKKSFESAWDFAMGKINDIKYDIIILDEINNIFGNTKIDFSDILTVEYFLDVLKKRPQNQTIVLTGRNAPDEVIAFADTVTEMKCIKHHLQEGTKAVKGIEY